MLGFAENMFSESFKLRCAISDAMKDHRSMNHQYQSLSDLSTRIHGNACFCYMHALHTYNISLSVYFCHFYQHCMQASNRHRKSFLMTKQGWRGSYCSCSYRYSSFSLQQRMQLLPTAMRRTPFWPFI